MIRNLLMIVAICLSFVANAQQIGTWKVHPIVGSNPNYLIATQDNVFYIVSNNLYCYDSGSEGIIHYNMQNYLSDSGVKNVYYNYDKHYLVVVYNNCNLDFITDEGKTYNFPDIRDVVITGETTAKSVNDVTFCPAANKAYIATSFGIVEIDDKKMEIRQSRRYYTSVNSVAQIGNYLVVSTAAGIYCDLASKPNMQLDAMATKFTGLTACTLYPINNNMFVAYKANTTHKCTIAADGTISSASIKGNTPDNCQKMSDGTILIPYAAQKVHIKITADGTSTQVNTPTAIGTEKFASYDGTFWTFSTTKGLRQLGSDGATTLHDYIAVNSTPVKDVYDMQFAHNTLYASNQSRGKIHTNASNTSLIGIYSCADELWKKVTLSGETNRIIPDPEDPTISWVEGAMGKGFHRLKDGVLNLTITNSPATNNNIIHLQFDDKNNLWVETFQGHVSYLPAKYRFDETIDTDKWVSYGQFFVDFRSWKDVFFITRSGAKFRSLAYDGFHAWTDDINKNIQYTSSNVITQDGAYFCPTDHYDFYEDSKGRVWASSGNGVYYFKSSDVGQHPLSVIRPKVPRNDGSGLADYLLDGITIYQIREDASGYKWIATASGLFKVSNDGTEILETFTTANAPFSSDVIYSVCPNLNNNSVYVGTPDGLFEYYSTTTPPQEDFSNVVAYPNPIRPDYTGPVTITGLMNNTLVKIVNVGGETVATLQSSGGTAIWDCNYPNGERVNTGVYYVVGGTDSTGKIMTKILVVK